jgi:hypothetical protein
VRGERGRERERERESTLGERGRKEERGRRGEETEDVCANWVFPFPPFIPSYGVVLPTFREGLPPLVNPFWKCPHRHTQRYVLLIS